MVSITSQARLLRARDAVGIVFAVNGFAFASWVSRIPESRAELGLTPGQLGTLLLALSVSALVALPSAGALVHAHGAAKVVAVAAVVDALGLGLAGVGADAASAVWLTAVGLLGLGFGSGVWDVAMNVEGAAVEHDLRRTIMPRFHAAFSLGTVVGAAVGVAAAAFGVPVTAHLLAAAVLVAALPPYVVRAFLPAGTAAGQGVQPEQPEQAADPHQQPRRHRHLRAWTEPRTLLIGIMVLAMALTEGTANDWLAVALVDGHDVEPWVGAAGFAVFVTAMTGGRLAGTVLLDRFGRLPVLWSTMGLAGAGVLVVVFGPWLALVFAGVVLWGLGASLGFPVGMSAAADDPAFAAARVSVVSTIGYTAFLAGPPLLGYLGDQLGVLQALLVVAVLLVPSVLAVPAARPVSSDRARIHR